MLRNGHVPKFLAESRFPFQIGLYAPVFSLNLFFGSVQEISFAGRWL